MSDLGEAHAKLLRDGAVQVRFAVPETLPPPVLPRPPSWNWSIDAWWSSALFWGLVVLFGVALVVVVAQVIRNGGSIRWRRKARRATAAAVAEPVAAAAPVDEADVLALSGDYGAAVHALLLRCIEIVRQRFPNALRPADTSREIAGLETLPVEARTVVGGIAAPVERAIFALRAVGQEEWENCRTLSARLRAGPR